ncbi:MAG: hypothetical protein JXR83_13085, partial [Deltaproteobacteria bacterium]|nr:hypothetical protein [Deltaproteobacteria bacterium]
MGDSRGIGERIAGLLSTIVGRRRAEPAAPPPAERRQSERRRHSRFLIRMDDGAEQGIFVTLAPAVTEYPIHDLGVHGFCLRLPDAASPVAEVGAVLDGTVRLGAISVALRLRVAHQRGEYLGCEIVEATGEWLEQVGKVLDPMRLGRQLREIDARFMAPDPTAARMRWFQAGPSCDLWVWYDAAGAIAKAQLFFMWQLVEWSAAHGLRSGESAGPPDRERGYAAAELYAL